MQLGKENNPSKSDFMPADINLNFVKLPFHNLTAHDPFFGNAAPDYEGQTELF
jgi:hypothetical protein